MKKKEHRFVLVVKTADTRRGARLAVLCAFAMRQPDACEFHLQKNWWKSKKVTVLCAHQNP